PRLPTRRHRTRWRRTPRHGRAPGRARARHRAGGGAWNLSPALSRPRRGAQTHARSPRLHRRYGAHWRAHERRPLRRPRVGRVRRPDPRRPGVARRLVRGAGRDHGRGSRVSVFLAIVGDTTGAFDDAAIARALSAMRAAPGDRTAIWRGPRVALAVARQPWEMSASFSG